jgi:hypothetical protein
MSEKRCNTCHAKSITDDKYCMFCGTEFSKIEDRGKAQTRFNIDKFFLVTKIIVGILICVIGIIMELEVQTIIYGAIGIELFINYIQVIINEKIRNRPQLNSKVYKQAKNENNDKHKLVKIVLIVVPIFILLISVMGYFNTVSTPDNRKKERYEFEIEPGYGFVSPISVLEMTGRMNKAISSVTEDYENLVVEDNYSQFFVEVDIYTTDDFRDAEETFRKLVDVLYTSDKYYSYIQDFQVHFYHNDQYVYSTRILNIFLIEEVSLNNDGTFYDAKSNTIVFFKTLEDKNFSFSDKRFNENNLDSKSENYIKAFNKWYQNFDQVLSRTYDAFDIVEIRFTNRGINPEMTELVNLGYKINDLKNQCKELNKLKPDFYHEVYYQYSQKGCQYYVRAFEINLDGLNNRSIERIQYSYIANNVGYSYIYWIYR